MDDDTIADLKQFIATTVTQQTASLKNDIQDTIQHLDDKLSTKIDDLSQSVAEALDASNESTDHQLKDHELRLTKLEHKAV